MRQFVILVGVPASTSKEAVIRSLPSNLRVVGVWIYLDQGMAVLQLPHAVSQDTLRTVNSNNHLLFHLFFESLQVYPNITVGSKDAFLSPSYLVLEMSSITHTDDFTTSRFHDKEVLFVLSF